MEGEVGGWMQPIARLDTALKCPPEILKYNSKPDGYVFVSIFMLKMKIGVWARLFCVSA
jgi:hypothetical protein